jgi:hypothetical protein
MKGLLLIAIVSLFLTAQVLSAFDTLYDNFESGMLKAGSVKIRLWADYGRAASYFDSTFTVAFSKDNYKIKRYPDTKYTNINVPLKFSYSVMDALEAGIIGQYVSRTIELTQGDSTTTTTSSGIGDTWVYAKYRLFKDPILNFQAAVKIPTGTWKDVAEGKGKANELAIGDGQMDLDFALNGAFPEPPNYADVEAGQWELRFTHWSFEYQVGFRYKMKRNFTSGPDIEEDVEETPATSIPFILREKICLSCNTYFWFLGLGGHFDLSQPETTTTSSAGTTTTVKGKKTTQVFAITGFEFRFAKGFYTNIQYQGTFMGQNAPFEWHVLAGGLGVIF